MAFRPTVVPNPPPAAADHDADLRHAEQEMAAAEAHWAAEAGRLQAAAGEVATRMQQLAASATQLQRMAPEAGAIAQRSQPGALPQLDLEDSWSQARAAREAAVRARKAANESARQQLAAFAAEVARLSSQLAADEAELSNVERRVREENARRVEAQKARVAAPPPPPPAAARPPTAPTPKPAAPTPPNLTRREGARVKMQAAIDLQSDSNFFTGFSTNISEGGIFVATVSTLKQGTQVDLAFSIPGGAKIEVKGVVRWSREVNDNTPDIFPGVGIQFTNLTPEASEMIQRFVGQREPLFFPD